MKPWQRNRFVLVIAIIASVVTANIPSLTTGQIVSLVALYFLLFYLYIKFLNRYQQ